MTRPRVHVAGLGAGPLTLDGEPFRYLVRVLRLRAGDEVALFDGAGRTAAARIVRVDLERGGLDLAVAPPEACAARARLPITLLASLLKGERMDLVVQKVTELGVERVIPVAARRSVVRLEPGRAASRVARWRKIALEAARQCGRADAPEIAEPAPLAEAVAAVPPGAWKAILYEEARAASLREALPATTPPAVALAVGPEGGFEPEEVAAAVAAGFVVAGLGPRVLRAETAALAAVAVVGFALGDLG